MNPRRLYRCRHDRILAGVAGGMAEYLEIDPTIVRILWILSIFLGGFGILLYILLAFVVPLEPVGPVAPAPGAMWGPAAPGTPGATGDAGATGAATETGTETATWFAGDAAGPVPGAAPGAAPATGWGTAWHNPPVERRPGRLGLYLGVILVVFGTIAMANVLIPGLVGGGLLGAGFLVALGVALLVGATRPAAADR